MHTAVLLSGRFPAWPGRQSGRGQHTLQGTIGKEDARFGGLPLWKNCLPNIGHVGRGGLRVAGRRSGRSGQPVATGGLSVPSPAQPAPARGQLQ